VRSDKSMSERVFHLAVSGLDSLLDGADLSDSTMRLEKLAKIAIKRKAKQVPVCSGSHLRSGKYHRSTIAPNRSCPTGRKAQEGSLAPTLPQSVKLSSTRDDREI
jgi:hypothetical protein